MKKILLCACCVILALLFAITVYAHSGKTDGSGGHYDHSTGDYHYHHGESAHDHYDIDGDGTVDCPKSFNYTKSLITKGGITTLWGIIALLLISAANAFVAELLIIFILERISIDILSCKKFLWVLAIVIFVISIVLILV